MGTSTWLKEIEIPSHPVLSGEIFADIGVIGGGLAGTLTAYLLAKAGKKVVILEKKDLKNSVTAYTTAWVDFVIDTSLNELVKMFGKEEARKVWMSGQDAINLIEKIVSEENIDCDFKRVSHFYFTLKGKEKGNLYKEHEAARSLGFESILHDSKILKFINYGSLEIRSQAKFQPLKFLIGLRKACINNGVEIYENSEVKDINSLLITPNGSVKASYVVITTYDPFNKPKELRAHTGKYISYVLEILVPKDIIPEGLYQDEHNPYHYFRVDHLLENDRIILGGEDHRKEIHISPEKNFKSLERYFKKIFPNIEYKINEKWSGPIIETIDGLPYIGILSKKNPNILVATGFSGNGMTYSAVSAILFKDVILGIFNPYEKTFSIDRKVKIKNVFNKFIDYTGEFFGGAVKNFFRF